MSFAYTACGRIGLSLALVAGTAVGVVFLEADSCPALGCLTLTRSDARSARETRVSAGAANSDQTSVSSDANATPAKDFSPLDVATGVTEPSEKDRSVLVIVTVRNRDSAAPIRNLKISIGSSSLFQAERSVQELTPRQSLAEEFDIPPQARTPYLFVSYDWNGQHDSVAQAIVRPAPLADDKVLSWLLPIISGIVGAIIALIGAWLSNVWANRRDRQREEFERGKMIFEKYEASYRQFLGAWAKSLSAVALKTQYQTLRQAALVPPGLRRIFDDTIKILSDGARSDADKETASSTLEQAIERYLEGPSRIFLK